MSAKNLLDISNNLDGCLGFINSNLEIMKGAPSDYEKLRQEAIDEVEKAEGEVRELRKIGEKMKKTELTDLLEQIDLSGELSDIEKRAKASLDEIRAYAAATESPDIDREQIKTLLDNLEKEMRKMKDEAVKKGICLLAIFARVAIKLLI